MATTTEPKKKTSDIYPTVEEVIVLAVLENGRSGGLLDTSDISKDMSKRIRRRVNAKHVLERVRKKKWAAKQGELWRVTNLGSRKIEMIRKALRIA